MALRSTSCRFPYPASKTYENVHIRDFPAFLRQTSPRATDPRLSLKYDPANLPDPTKQRGVIGKVGDFPMALRGEKSGNVAVGQSKLIGRTIFSLRAFVEFQVRWGIGAYGKELDARLRRMAAYGEEEILASGARCLISNRMSYGFSTLKIGTVCRCNGG